MTVAPSLGVKRAPDRHTPCLRLMSRLVDTDNLDIDSERRLLPHLGRVLATRARAPLPCGLKPLPPRRLASTIFPPGAPEQADGARYTHAA